MSDDNENIIDDSEDCTVLVKKPFNEINNTSIIDDATLLAQGKRRVQVDDDQTRLISKSNPLHNKTNEEELERSDYSSTDMTGSLTGTSLTDAINRTQQEVIGLKSRNRKLKIINQRFLLASKLGVGGMGAVYKAKDLRKVEAQDKNPWVAVKLLNEAFKEHPTAFIALQREAQKSQKLAHPNIVRVYDFDRDGETVYMTMELLQGEDLNHIIKRNKKGLDRSDALNIIRQVGGALAEAHKHNIVHSDFKPGNIFYTKEKIAKVFDFGIARAVSEIGSGAISVEANGHSDTLNDNEEDKTLFDASLLNALTPAYASKEMHDGQDACKSDDVYALGCVAYEVLVGKHPYGKTPANKIIAKQYKLPVIEGLKRKQLRALQKSIAIDRNDRYQTVDEFLNDFLPERNKLSNTVKVSVFILTVALFSTAVLYYKQQSDIRLKEQALLEEQKRIDQQKIAAEMKTQLERTKSLAIDAVNRETQLVLESHEQKTSLLKKRLDEHAFVSSSSDSLEWQLAVSRDIAELASIYDNNEPLSKLLINYSEDYLKVIINKSLNNFDVNKRALDVWLNGYHQKISNVYLAKARDEIYIENYASAQKLIGLARQYQSDNSKIDSLQDQLTHSWDAKKLKDQAQLRQESYRSYEIFNESAGRHVLSCSEQLAAGGSGFSYDMKTLQTKLTLLNRKFRSMRAEVTRGNKAHVESLGRCIRLYGESYPKQATSVLTKAKKLFPSYITILNKVTIRPFDSCNPSFAGKGRRYSCSDRLINNLTLSGPELIVIRGKSSGVFAIGKYEVTQGQFSEYCQVTGLCEVADEKEKSLPATGYTLKHIKGYVNWLNQETGFSYQIPTHAQWLLAAKARTGSLDNNRNCQLNARGLVKGVRLFPVDIGQQNGWGMVNHVGNAQEFVSIGGQYQVAGGSKLTPMENCSIDTLKPYTAEEIAVTGFRVVRKVELSR